MLKHAQASSLQSSDKDSLSALDQKNVELVQDILELKRALGHEQAAYQALKANPIQAPIDETAAMKELKKRNGTQAQTIEKLTWELNDLKSTLKSPVRTGYADRYNTPRK